MELLKMKTDKSKVIERIVYDLEMDLKLHIERDVANSIKQMEKVREDPPLIKRIDNIGNSNVTAKFSLNFELAELAEFIYIKYIKPAQLLAEINKETSVNDTKKG